MWHFLTARMDAWVLSYSLISCLVNGTLSASGHHRSMTTNGSSPTNDFVKRTASPRPRGYGWRTKKRLTPMSVVGEPTPTRHLYVFFQILFQFRSRTEMVLNRTFLFTLNDQNVFNPAGLSLFNDELNGWFYQRLVTSLWLKL